MQPLPYSMSHQTLKKYWNKDGEDPTKTTLIIMEECLQQPSAITTLVAIANYTPIGSTRGWNN